MSNRNCKNRLPEEYLKNGGPGRPKGSVGGRTKALNTLDRVWSKAESQKAFEEALKSAIEKDSIKVFRELVMPLLPKDLSIKPDDKIPGLKITFE